MLDLFLELLAPIAYNKGLDDAMSWYKGRRFIWSRNGIY